MLVVRFPTGVSITYNNADHLRYRDHGFALYAGDPDKGGKWVASIQLSAGAIVESLRACKVEQAALTVADAARLLASTDELRRLDATTLRRLKATLAAFNAKTLEWK